MHALQSLLVGVAFHEVGAVALPSFSVYNVPSAPPSGTQAPILSSFVSYSVEFAFWPDYAGNKSHPNIFSENLLNSIGRYSGSKPIIRVGGNTQDYALWDPDLTVATNATYGIPTINYPNLLYYGPSYFESYGTFKDTKYIHGFNMGRNGTAGWESLLATVPHVCQALKGGRLEHLELGNEPDQYKTISRGIVGPSTWTEKDYVEEWKNKTRAMRQVWCENCPNEHFDFIGPSTAGLNSTALRVLDVYRNGYTEDRNIAQVSAHSYMGSSDDPAITLANSLLNRTATLDLIARHRRNADELIANHSIPYVLGEGNSLFREGRAGLSDSFGAALWAVDFGLAAASRGGPRDTEKAIRQTRPPFYGHLALAAALGDSGKSKVRVSQLELDTQREAAYAIYNDDRLARIAVLNLNEHNATATDPWERPVDTYTFRLPRTSKKVTVRRLESAGADAITGITFDGYSYNYVSDEGKPVHLKNVTVCEKITIGKDGNLQIKLPWSSMAVLDVD